MDKRLDSSSSSNGEGTLSGQTSSSGVTFSDSSGSTVNAFVVETDTVNSDDDRSDGTCDYGDDTEQQTSQAARTYLSVDLPSDASSGHKHAKKKRKDTKSSNGDTGSSSSIVLPITGNGASSSHFPTPTKRNDIDDLSMLVDNLRLQLQQEHVQAVEETKKTLVFEASRSLEYAKQEEAWTAQQHMDQVNASAHVESEIRSRQVAELEYRANTLYEQEARAAALERNKNVLFVQEAQQEILHKESTAKCLESEVTRLRKELATSNQAIAEEQARNRAIMTEGTKEVQFTKSKYENFKSELIEAKEREREEARAREIKMEERFLSILKERDEQAARSLSAARAADTSHLRMTDMAFALQQCLQQVKILATRIDQPNPSNTPSFASGPIHPGDGPNVLKATLTAKPSTTRTTPSRSSQRGSQPTRTNGDDDVPMPNGHSFSLFGPGDGGGHEPPEDPDDDERKKKRKKKKKSKKKKKKDKKDKKSRHHDDDDEDDYFPSGDPPSHSSSSDSSSSSSSSSTSSSKRRSRRETVRTKEADSIKLLPLPDKAGQFRRWRLSTRRKVIAASANPATAYNWIKMVEDKEVSFEDLRISGSFLTLDTKLGSSISEIAKGELGRRLTLTTEREDKEGRNVTGRQLLKVVYEYYKTDESAGILYDVSDLMNVRIRGDNPGWKQLQDFRDSWDETLAGMENEPSDDILEPMFRDRIKDCRNISHDYETYIRADKGTPQKSYQFLYDAVDNFLLRKLRENNRYDVQKKNKDHGRSDRHNSRSRPAAPAAQKDKKKGKKQPRGNSRGSGKRDSSTESNRRLTSKQKGGACYTWKNTGKCEKHEKGDCGYSHKEEERGINKKNGRGRSKSSGSSSSSKSNKSKGRGKGKKGKRSPTPPADRKKTTCTFFIRLKCTKGEDCEFKHDVKEQEEYQKKAKKKDFQ